MSWSKLIVFALVLNACSTANQSGYAHLLKVKEIKARQVFDLPFQYHFYRLNDTLCSLSVEFETHRFLAMKDTSDHWLTDIEVNLLVQRNQFAGKQFYQKSIRNFYADSTRQSVHFAFSLPEEKDLFYELTLTDQNKHVYGLKSAFWERSQPFLPEDVTLCNEKGERLLCDLITDLAFSLKLNDRWKDSLFQLEVFANQQSAAQPIGAEGAENSFHFLSPDTLFEGDIHQINAFLQEGQYPYPTFRLKPKTESASRYFSFTQSIPQRNRDALVYLLTEESDLEYVDGITWMKYWFKASNGNAFKEEKLIKEFLQRVTYANDFFTSYKQGWQTDKGMVHILFGKPDRILEDIHGETWMYGFSEVNGKNFVFQKSANRLHPNDFLLDRNSNFRELEQDARLRWTNGWVSDNLDRN